MHTRIAVRGIALHNSKMLAVRLISSKDTSGYTPDYWCTPGGGLDSNESLTDGLVREMVEETGVTPTVGALLYIQQFSHKGNEHLEFFFHILNAQDYTCIDLSTTSHGNIELQEIAFVDPQTTPLLPNFLMTEDLAKKIAHPKTTIYSFV